MHATPLLRRSFEPNRRLQVGGAHKVSTGVVIALGIPQTHRYKFGKCPKTLQTSQGQHSIVVTQAI